jgi:hypothetical protein
VVPPESAEQFAASAERFDQGKPVDAPPAAVSLAGLVESDNDGWSVKFPAEPRGDDADNAVMPSIAADNQSAVASRVENLADLLERRFEDLLLEILPLTIADI